MSASVCVCVYYPTLPQNDLHGHFSTSLVLPGAEFCQRHLRDLDPLAFIDSGNSPMKTCFSQVSF